MQNQGQEAALTMRWWGSGSRRRLEIEVAILREQLAAAREASTRHESAANYWRARAEKLIDSSLAKRGDIHEPTMAEPKREPQNVHALVMKSFGTTEINKPA